MTLDLQHIGPFPLWDEVAALIVIDLFFLCVLIWALTQLGIHFYLQPRPFFTVPKVYHVLVVVFCAGASRYRRKLG
jgi:hypothetical protein